MGPAVTGADAAGIIIADAMGMMQRIVYGKEKKLTGKDFGMAAGELRAAGAVLMMTADAIKTKRAEAYRRWRLPPWNVGAVTGA